ncbi:uncharacterized protein LOC105695983 [Orussus abietinus]|uniref:uncharacterized protein LOC105695983 n=1 Tax=Orussus abietinus TaxID=222816 RepID=UPI000C7161DB|nr:uncharacterized protein LOC105695983 [Orussus abietinus]
MISIKSRREKASSKTFTKSPPGRNKTLGNFEVDTPGGKPLEFPSRLSRESFSFSSRRQILFPKDSTRGGSFSKRSSEKLKLQGRHKRKSNPLETPEIRLQKDEISSGDFGRSGATGARKSRELNGSQDATIGEPLSKFMKATLKTHEIDTNVQSAVHENEKEKNVTPSHNLKKNSGRKIENGLSKLKDYISNDGVPTVQSIVNAVHEQKKEKDTNCRNNFGKNPGKKMENDFSTFGNLGIPTIQSNSGATINKVPIKNVNNDVNHSSERDVRFLYKDKDKGDISPTYSWQDAENWTPPLERLKGYEDFYELLGRSKEERECRVKYSWQVEFINCQALP